MVTHSPGSGGAMKDIRESCKTKQHSECMKEPPASSSDALGLKSPFARHRHAEDLLKEMQSPLEDTPSPVQTS